MKFANGATGSSMEIANQRPLAGSKTIRGSKVVG